LVWREDVHAFLRVIKKKCCKKLYGLSPGYRLKQAETQVIVEQPSLTQVKTPVIKMPAPASLIKIPVLVKPSSTKKVTSTEK
jgi:hypothetical protein